MEWMCIACGFRLQRIEDPGNPLPVPNCSNGPHGPMSALQDGPVPAAQDWNELQDHLVELARDPVALLERRIATSSLAELDDLNEALERVGTRMVERAAELRRKLKEQT